MQAVIDGVEQQIDELIVNQTMYGYGVYSSFSVHDNSVVGWQYHLDRLRSDSRGFLGLQVTEEQIRENVLAFLASAKPEGAITCRVTIFPADFNLAKPNLVKRPRILVTGRSGSSVSGHPLKLVIQECDRPFAQYKITAISAAMHMRGLAKARGYDDPLFRAREFITEGPTWNVFFVGRDMIHTPTLDDKLLPGVTRQLITDLLGGDLKETAIRFDEISEFTGAFVTNAAIGVVPVASIDQINFDSDSEWVAELHDKYVNLDRTVIA